MAEVVTNLREPAPSSPPGGRPGAGLAISLALRLLSVGPLLILIVLVAGISLLTPNFLKPVNISNILAQTAVIAIVAIGQHLVILTRGIDLSVGANLALATVVGGLVFRMVDSALLVALAMLLTGAAVGAVNGVVYVFGRLPHPFIITLATLSICRGLALELAPGHTTMRGMPDWIVAVGGSDDLRRPELLLRRARCGGRRAVHGQGDGLGPLDLRRRRRSGSRAWRWAFPSRGCWSRPM